MTADEAAPKPAPSKALGRGLAALLGEAAMMETKPAGPTETGPGSGRGLRDLPIEQLRPGRFQPRRFFDPEALDQLAQSIREKGIVEPLIVRRLPEADAYEIVAGERRWRAAQAVPLHTVPALVKELSDTEALELALIENVQRQDLGPLEECDGYSRLIEEFGHTQEQVARIVGKSRSHVANTLRLATLPVEVKDLLDQGKLTAGHARAIMNLPDPVPAARTVAAKGLSVRQAEAFAKRLAASPAGALKKIRKKIEKPKDPDTLDLERDLTSTLGMHVSIDHDTKNQAGEIRIRYLTLDQLEDICRRLQATPG
ncbi:MAG: ParB/RepB/Spo0J family partition protein [Alphaproteobacteria bacterium]|nr:ParB/RepB/Spo0J family partition protein [Alphaproteobacteria bacterium]